MPKGKRNNRRKIGPMKPEVLEALREGKVMTFNRVQTTGRLLENAIKLWFHDGDPLSIHLLASAVCRVLDDLGREDGKGPRIKTLVSDEQYTMAYDYLRHASPARKTTALAFAPALNGIMLFDAVCSFEKVSMYTLYDIYKPQSGAGRGVGRREAMWLKVSGLGIARIRLHDGSR